MKLLRTVVFLMLLPFVGLSQVKTFNFKAQVFYNKKPLKGATVEVYQAGNLITEQISKGNGKVQFELEAESEYIVEVSMTDLRTKAIWINTKNTSETKFNIPAFAFYVHLEDEGITPYDELSEIPVTLIKYRPTKDEFFMDRTFYDALKS